MKFGLKKKILVPTSILIISMMGASTGINYLWSSKSLNENAVEQLSTIARSKAELFDL